MELTKIVKISEFEEEIVIHFEGNRKKINAYSLASTFETGVRLILPQFLGHSQMGAMILLYFVGFFVVLNQFFLQLRGGINPLPFSYYCPYLPIILSSKAMVLSRHGS